MFASLVSMLLAAVAVSLLIVAHEFGHLIAAKAVGMRVEVFSIGFWKRIVGFKWGDTDYRVSLIPLGGYVKVTGEVTGEGGGEPYEYLSKTPGQRALYILGGVTLSFMLAFGLFIVAFALGVPFLAAEVGETDPGLPAWKAGMKVGDRIVAVGDNTSPVFNDIIHASALGAGRPVRLRVLRGEEELSFTLRPEYDEEIGYRRIGVRPSLEPLVSGIAEDSPAQAADIRPLDRILAINGKHVTTGQELIRELYKYPNDEIEVLLERDGRSLTKRVRTVPAPYYAVGISGVGSVVKFVEGAGAAQTLGLRPGDRITAVNGQSIRSVIAMEEVVRRSPGEVRLNVARGSGPLVLTTDLPDILALEQFLSSIVFESGATLEWVREGAPAWAAGLRPGDQMVSVGGVKVNKWTDIVRTGLRAHDEEHEVQWLRGDRLMTARVTAVEDTSLSGGQLGVVLAEPKTDLRRFVGLAAVRRGFVDTMRTLSEIFLTVRGFATREVSPRQMRGIGTIAYLSYQAAEQGLGMLLYITAKLSAMLALLNILPMPVLDGGHLLFLLIEKLRGKRVSMRAMSIAQTVGFALLMLLVVYAVRNDISYFLQLR